MHIDPSQHSTRDNYKLFTNIVVPRPIAWVSTLNQSGTVNLAPFSFFNAVSSEPLLVMVSVGTRGDDSNKDTANNIRSNGEFVVNMITEELMNAMNISAADFPPEQSELDAAGLHAAPSIKIKTPRIAESHANLECTLYKELAIGSNSLFFGEVQMFHVARQLVDQKLRVQGFAPIGRMGSPSNYCRTKDWFELARVSYEQVKDAKF
jgi:flavin reductase (DIM6/NTAB) family NADH-FMN oxidoreductase RutF